MKSLIILSLNLTFSAFAAPALPGNTESLFIEKAQNKPETEHQSTEKNSSTESAKLNQTLPNLEDSRLQESRKPERKKVLHINRSDSNLPDYFLNSDTSPALEARLIVPTNVRPELPYFVTAGLSVPVSIEHSIIAFNGDKFPVIARVLEGNLRGSSFVGMARLEDNSQRIFIDFDQLNRGSNEFKIRASMVSESGDMGLQGEYVSKEALLTAADFLTHFSAAYFDAQVPRTKNVFGQEVADTSVDSAVKKGLAGSSLALSERIREKLKKQVSYSVVKGPIEAKILILSRKNSND